MGSYVVYIETRRTEMNATQKLISAATLDKHLAAWIDSKLQEKLTPEQICKIMVISMAMSGRE
jgi:IS30 family transposase